MRWAHLGLILLAAAWFGARAEDPAVEGREARLAAAALLRQNEALRVEVARLREEVGKLTLAFAQAKAELDEATAGRGVRGTAPAEAGTDGGPGAATVAAGRWLITDVNPDLKLVVLDAGRSSGLRQGMKLYAMRGEKPGARLRVADVRERITGAVIEETWVEGGPVKGDQAVLMAAPK